MPESETPELNSILQTTADMLDIPDHVYEDAVLKYEDVSEHMASDESGLDRYDPHVYVQGSFRLGTVVQPYGREDEYDIDLVCQLKINKESISQKDLKNKVGDGLKVRADLEKIVEPSRRCWKLNYPSTSAMPSFHMDVLPSIYNQERLPTGILLTDTELISWQKSNPIAYGEWFKKRMAVVFQLKKTALAKSMMANIEEVPDWRVKTPLQRCVQILKRHRDIYFRNSSNEKPVSIILTTLAAHAYQNEEDIFEALKNISKSMHKFIENREGKWWVQNPVDDGENFADKWNEYPDRRIAFMEWLNKVNEDFSAFSKSSTIESSLEILNKSIGRDTMDLVASKLNVRRDIVASSALIKREPSVPSLGNVNHVEPISSKVYVNIISKYKATLSAGVHLKKGDRKGKLLWSMRNKPVPADVWLKFKLKTNVPEPYTVLWQVVNTGQEAQDAGEPRGELLPSDEPNKKIRWESTKYRGTHWVEAFIINNEEICVAQTGKFYVKIR